MKLMEWLSLVATGASVGLVGLLAWAAIKQITEQEPALVAAEPMKPLEVADVLDEVRRILGTARE